MQVILLDKVANLGSLGDQVNVKAGYARNFLVPQGKAVPATKKNVEFFEARRAELEAKLADVLAAFRGGDGDAAVLQVPGIRHRDGGQKDRDQCQRDEPGQKFSDVHSVASLQWEGFVVYKPIITWIGRKCKRINGFISGASAGFPVAKGSHL